MANFKESLTYIETAIECYRVALFPLESMIYLRAMVYKNIGQFVKASRDYQSLAVIFKKNEHKAMIKYVMGILLLPL